MASIVYWDNNSAEHLVQMPQEKETSLAGMGEQ
jgi:hypothetical protein